MRRPMNRLIENTVFWGLVTAWRFATWPTRRSPSFVNATTEGVVRPPSELGITVGESPSRTATTELVVPRSIPTTLLIAHASVDQLSRQNIGSALAFVKHQILVFYTQYRPTRRPGQ